MLQLVESLFSLWNNNGVVYCSWKGNCHLDDAMNGTSDFDILISAESLERGTSLLKKAGYLLLITQPEARYPGIQDWVGVDSSAGMMIHIHLHQYMIAGHSGVMEYILPWNELVFSNRQFNEEYGLYMMNPNLELILLYTRLGIEQSPKKLMKTREGWVIKEKTKKEILHLKKKMDKALCLRIARDLFPDCYDSLMLIVEKEKLETKDLDWLIKLMKNACDKWLRYDKLQILYKETKLCLRILARRIRKNGVWRGNISKKVLSSRMGVSIAFIGQDGCGKSTVTQEIEKWLNWKIDSHRFYLGSGDHYNGFLKIFLNRIANLKKSSNNSNNIERPTNKQRNKKRRQKNLKNFLTAYLISLNHINVVKHAYKEVCLSERYRCKGGIPLFDRFPQNQFEGIYDGPKISAYIYETGLDYWLIRQMAKKEKKYIKKIQQYRPKLIFKLLLPPEESIRRKPFEDIQAVTRKHEITKILEFPDSKVLIVDAMQDYQKELIFIKNEIWKTIKENQ